MGGNIGKPASSKDGSEKTELSSSFNQPPGDISTGGGCASATSGLQTSTNGIPNAVEKPMLPTTPSFDNPGPVEQCLMVVLYDFAATLDSQLTVKRGKYILPDCLF